MLSTIPSSNRQTTPTWRQIEAALQDYFGGVSDGDIFATLNEDDPIFDEVCDDCPRNDLVEINLTEIAKHIADFIGVDA